MQSLKVKDYMNPHVVTFEPNMSLTVALDKVTHSRFLGGPVIDEHTHVVGFLSEQDLLDQLVNIGYHCQDSHVVADCMYKEVLSVSSNTSILELADLMKSGKPKVYPVIDNGVLVGIISRREVLEALKTAIDRCFQKPI